MPASLVVFLDYQNVYSIARAYFHPALAPAQAGQIDPLRLGEVISTKSSDRELFQVRVYRGRPDSQRDPRGYGANLRQCTRWERDPRVKVIWRTLRYPQNWPQEKEEEKGIDVALAIDFVTMAVRGEYDVGVIMSTDTDLKPALESVHGRQSLPEGRGRGLVDTRAAFAAPQRPGSTAVVPLAQRGRLPSGRRLHRLHAAVTIASVNRGFGFESVRGCW